MSGFYMFHGQRNDKKQRFNEKIMDQNYCKLLLIIHLTSCICVINTIFRSLEESEVVGFFKRTIHREIKF